jgi:adenylate kinase
MKIVLLGPPGAGKGTQAARISSQFGVISLSTGDIFRAVAASPDSLGIKISSLIARGELVPDALVNDVVLSKLTSDVLKSGFVLDGFPRTVSQAVVLAHFLSDNQTCLTAVIDIKVDQNILFDRIQNRVLQSGMNVRNDDTEQVLIKRLSIYNELTKPLLSYYKKQGVLRSVDGMASIDSVTDDIISALSEIKNSNHV